MSYHAILTREAAPSKIPTFNNNTHGLVLVQLNESAPGYDTWAK